MLAPEKEPDDDISEQEDSSIANPFGTTWEASQSHISEDIPNTLWESSEEDDEGDFVDQFKSQIINIKKEPYYFFVAISVLVIIILVFITINI